MIETKFLSDEAPRESVHYDWIAFIISILLWEWEKKNYLQVCSEKYKQKIKKIKMHKFITTEFESELELKTDSE